MTGIEAASTVLALVAITCHIVWLVVRD